MKQDNRVIATLYSAYILIFQRLAMSLFHFYERLVKTVTSLCSRVVIEYNSFNLTSICIACVGVHAMDICAGKVYLEIMLKG